MQRIYAHDIIFDGCHYSNHIAQLDESTGEISLYPFTQEIHSTRYFSGTVEIKIGKGRFVVSRPTVAAKPSLSNS